MLTQLQMLLGQQIQQDDNAHHWIPRVLADEQSKLTFDNRRTIARYLIRNNKWIGTKEVAQFVKQNIPDNEMPSLIRDLNVTDLNYTWLEEFGFGDFTDFIDKYFAEEKRSQAFGGLIKYILLSYPDQGCDGYLLALIEKMRAAGVELTEKEIDQTGQTLPHYLAAYKNKHDFLIKHIMRHQKSIRNLTLKGTYKQSILDVFLSNKPDIAHQSRLLYLCIGEKSCQEVFTRLNINPRDATELMDRLLERHDFESFHILWKRGSQFRNFSLPVFKKSLAQPIKESQLEAFKQLCKDTRWLFYSKTYGRSYAGLTATSGVLAYFSYMYVAPGLAGSVLMLVQVFHAYLSGCDDTTYRVFFCKPESIDETKSTTQEPLLAATMPDLFTEDRNERQNNDTDSSNEPMARPGP